jgi:hypothetical protein
LFKNKTSSDTKATSSDHEVSPPSDEVTPKKPDFLKENVDEVITAPSQIKSKKVGVCKSENKKVTKCVEE